MSDLRNRILSLKQDVILSIYFEIPVIDINWSTQSFKNKLHNPFREDKNPSLAFQWYGNKLITRDFGDSAYNGDIFKIVGYILNRNCFINTQFVEICEDILLRYNGLSKEDISKGNELRVINSVKTITHIDTKLRSLQNRDYDYFTRYCIHKHTTDRFVSAVIRYSINGRLTNYSNSYKDPCYQYTVNKQFVKLYFPFRNKKSAYPRFLTNNILQLDDITEIQYYNDIILVKSIKDKMLLIQILEKLQIIDIGIFTASSEIKDLDPRILQILRKNRKYNIYSMFDCDNTGIAAMESLKETGIIPLMFSDAAKDPTDFAKAFGYTQTEINFLNCIKTIVNNRKIKLL